MPETGPPTARQRRRAIAAVKHHAHGSGDEAELLAMLGLDQAVPAPPAPRRPHDTLSVAELVELFAPLASERAHTR